LSLGRVLIGIGLLFLAAGAAVWLLERAHLPLGRLPGDVTWRRNHTTIYFPWVTCLVLSALGSLLLWLFSRR
jgi:hypothetical protein